MRLVSLLVASAVEVALAPPQAAGEAERESEAPRAPPAPMGLSMETAESAPSDAGPVVAESDDAAAQKLPAEPPIDPPIDPQGDVPVPPKELEPRLFIRFSIATGLVSRTSFERCSIGGGNFGGGRVPTTCSLSPIVRTTWEIGKPYVSFLVELESAPVPALLTTRDHPFLDVLGVAAGISAGGHRVRGALTGGVGVVYARGDARLAITPWVDRKGHRHGFEIGAGVGFPILGLFVLSYRFVPSLRKMRASIRNRRPQGKGGPPWWPRQRSGAIDPTTRDTRGPPTTGGAPTVRLPTRLAPATHGLVEGPA